MTVVGEGWGQKVTVHADTHGGVEVQESGKVGVRRLRYTRTRMVAWRCRSRGRLGSEGYGTRGHARWRGGAGVGDGVVAG